jgi:hypothetical protein
MPKILVTWENKIWRIGPVWESSLSDLISKITRAKWTKGVAQAVEDQLFKYLLCKLKALSSNLGFTISK